MDNQGYFRGFSSKKSSSEVELNTCCLSWLLPWIYTSSSSMDHRIRSLLILAPCMNACSSFDNIIGSFHLGDSTLSSASLLPSAKCHKYFSNFLLIVDFFMSLLLLGFFKIDFDNNFHMNCY